MKKKLTKKLSGGYSKNECFRRQSKIVQNIASFCKEIEDMNEGKTDVNDVSLFMFSDIEWTHILDNKEEYKIKHLEFPEAVAFSKRIYREPIRQIGIVISYKKPIRGEDKQDILALNSVTYNKGRFDVKEMNTSSNLFYIIEEAIAHMDFIVQKPYDINVCNIKEPLLEYFKKLQHTNIVYL